jgi:superfamily I DNA and/or RNA helicase
MLQDKVKIIVKGKDKTDTIRSWSRNGDKINIIYSDGKAYSYNKSSIQFKYSVLYDESVLNCFNYFKQISKVTGLKDPNGKNILLSHYEKIDFLSEECMLAAFLTGELQNTYQSVQSNFIYPFGFNLSQKEAVDNALTNPLTIIEGPPGTGKTQTILNIISNAVMRGKSVAVVSSNNSATANVLEKLKKYDVDFIAAYLGNSDNKQEFIESQKPLPKLVNWKLSNEQEFKIKQSIQSLNISLNEMLRKKNKLSQSRQELDALELEYKHFAEYCNYSDDFVSLYLKPTTSSETLELWSLCEKYIERNKMPGFFKRIINRFKYGVINKAFYSITHDVMISICQKRWYTIRIKELTESFMQIQTELNHFNFSVKMKEYSNLSAELFRNELAKKYASDKRHKFEIDDLWRNSKQFITEYPVILSTTYSLRSSLSHRVMYDYVIIDEASQVDLVTGALALSCAKNAVIVGDLKQLPNVVDSNSAQRTDAIFAEFALPEMYRYKNHSLLSTISQIFPKAPKTLLREHYRCHSKIIQFCNQKFYDNQLIVLTELKSERQPLIIYKTIEGNHARDRVNQRQIDVIKNEIMPQQKLTGKNVSIGIVTPYRNQTNALQKAFTGTGIQADTVDKFQGRENNIIILSTVDNEITDFTDNANRLNFADSRAIEQLIVVINGGDDTRDTNIGDLVRYIEYNNLEIIQSEVYSVFDYLYKNYYEKKNKLLSKQKKVSKYDSENLMYTLICDVLCEERFLKFDVAVHVPLKMILRDITKLEENEKHYAENILTHVDFLIFDKLGKVPRLIIEVDGVKFHIEGTRQSERDVLKNSILEKYDLPFIRFKTSGSGEREQLVSKLNSIMN